MLWIPILRQPVRHLSHQFDCGFNQGCNRHCTTFGNLSLKQGWTGIIFAFTCYHDCFPYTAAPFTTTTSRYLKMKSPSRHYDVLMETWEVAPNLSISNKGFLAPPTWPIQPSFSSSVWIAKNPATMEPPETPLTILGINPSCAGLWTLLDMYYRKKHANFQLSNMFKI